MMPPFDLYGELAAAARDADGAWRFVRRFAEWDGRPLSAADGCDDGELAEARQPLPRALREAYALIGRRRDLTRNQDRLLAPREVYVEDTGRVLVFRVENQHVTRWGIPVAALGEPDPPVVFEMPTGTGEWRPFLDRVSLAAVEMVLSEWMLSGDVADNRDLDDAAALAALETGFHRLPLPDYPLWAGPDGRPMRWFTGPDVTGPDVAGRDDAGPDAILRDDAGVWLWVRATTPRALAAVRDALPGDWLMVED